MLVLKALIAGITCFPNSFAPSIQSKQTGARSTQSSLIFEKILARYSQSSDSCSNSLLADQIIQLTTQMLACLIRARERARQSYSDSVMRILTNIQMLTDVLKPRKFDSFDLQTELPQDTAFYFCYNQFSEQASEANKILIQDIRGPFTSFYECQSSLKILFRLLKESLTVYEALPGVFAGGSQSQQGRVKKGMPGFQEFGTLVDVEPTQIIQILINFLQISTENPLATFNHKTNTTSYDPSSQVCGMHPAQYSHLISLLHSETLSILPTVLTLFRDASLPMIKPILAPLKQLSQEKCIKNGDIQTYFEILELCSHMLIKFGVGSVFFVEKIAF